MILGLDAAAVEFALAEDRLIDAKDGDYVQLIRTSSSGALSKGSQLASGHDNIYIKNCPCADKHMLALDLHYRIMAGLYVLIADINGPGIIRNYYGMTKAERARLVRPSIRKNQCLVGIFSLSHAGNVPRNFTISVGNKLPQVDNRHFLMRALGSLKSLLGC